MESDNYHNEDILREKYKVWFCAGGETRDDRFNIFTGSFIRLMKKIMKDDFGFIKGIYYKSPMMNVIWALNNAQKPITKPENEKIFMAAFTQIIEAGLSPETQLVITSSGIILHDEVQDEGDTSIGVGGTTRLEAYRNAFGLMFPFFSRKFKGPSFLNTNPETSHIHRRRSKTVQKAIDYIDIILIKHKLAGDHYMERALEVISEENRELIEKNN